MHLFIHPFSKCPELSVSSPPTRHPTLAPVLIRISLAKLTVTELVKKFPECSLRCSQQPATGLFSEPHESNPHLPTLLP